jgi:hypothetical protein
MNGLLFAKVNPDGPASAGGIFDQSIRIDGRDAEVSA